MSDLELGAVSASAVCGPRGGFSRRAGLTNDFRRAYSTLRSGQAFSRRAVIALTVFLSACTSHIEFVSTNSAAGGECTRPPAKPFTEGDTLTVTDTGPVPCQIELADLGIELRADTSAQITSRWRNVAQDAEGRFYTSTGLGEAMLWGADGKFIRNFGHLGEGPGEFWKGELRFFATADSNILIADGKGRISVFDRNQKFRYLLLARELGYSPVNMQMLPGMIMLASEYYGNDTLVRNRYFKLVDFSESPSNPKKTNAMITKYWGEASRSDTHNGFMIAMPRAISPPVNGEFWVGPPEGAGHGYELQLWGLDGKLKRTIKREVSWFPKDADRDLNADKGEETALGGTPDHPEPKPLTRVISARDDGHGLLYVVILSANDKWNGTLGETKAASEMEMLALELHVEVIDANAGVVLASTPVFPLGEAREKIPSGWFGMGWKGFQTLETTEGSAKVRMIEVRLKGN